MHGLEAQMGMSLRTLKVWVGDTISHPAVGRVIGFVSGNRISCRGVAIDTRPPCISPHSVASMFWGLYEKDEIRFVRRYLRRDLDVVELGASIGVVSSHLARIQEPGHKLVCVEANPRLIDAARRNLDLNAPGKPVEIVHAAVDYSGKSEVQLALGADHLDSRVDGMGASTVAVPATTLAEILTRHGVDEYALVCDIEGAEAGLLLTEDAALARCRQMVIELHATRHQGRAYSETEMVGLLRDRHGFRVRDSRNWVLILDRGS